VKIKLGKEYFSASTLQNISEISKVYKEQNRGELYAQIAKLQSGTCA